MLFIRCRFLFNPCYCLDFTVVLLMNIIPYETMKRKCSTCRVIFCSNDSLQKRFHYECGHRLRFEYPHCEYYSQRKSNVIRYTNNRYLGIDMQYINVNVERCKKFHSYCARCKYRSRKISHIRVHARNMHPGLSDAIKEQKS